MYKYKFRPLFFRNCFCFCFSIVFLILGMSNVQNTACSKTDDFMATELKNARILINTIKKTPLTFLNFGAF